MSYPQFSLVIPCYNEADTLPALISRLANVFSTQKAVEVLLVDNGSTDDTLPQLREAVARLPFLRTVHVPRNQGYGYGILQGLSAAQGEFLGWTHADMQTDPADALRGFEMLLQAGCPSDVFLKGKRQNRPLSDVAFTVGMSLFESFLFAAVLQDINAQPTIFSRNFYQSWKKAPYDFALDLYAYAAARQQRLSVRRFPVQFGARLHGISHWNISWKDKIKFIRRTVQFSLELRRNWKKEL